MLVLRIRGQQLVEVEHGLRVGRDPVWANLALDRAFISRRHMEIVPEDAGYRLWDLGSQNGTRVNGDLVGDGGASLSEGDRIGIGDDLVIEVVSQHERRASMPTTVCGRDARRLAVELRGDSFIVEYMARGRILRDNIPYQLGLALSVLVLYGCDRLGPVPDADLRAIVWRGDPKLQLDGDINRLLHRLRQWFDERTDSPPTVARPRRAGVTRLLMPASSMQVRPEGWLYRYLDR
jgi:pSer/pThr/pTyr-binding forkhead associated (FHA) protein